MSTQLDTDPREALATHLKKWRQLKKLTQEQAAKRLRISLRTWQGWEAGRHAPAGLAWDLLMARTSK